MYTIFTLSFFRLHSLHTMFYLLPTSISRMAAYRAVRSVPYKYIGICVRSVAKKIRWIIVWLASYEPEYEVLQLDTKNGRLLFRKRKLLQIFKVHSQRERTLVIPYGNCGTEQLFSHMGLNKTKTRNSLSTSTLNSLLIIELN